MAFSRSSRTPIIPRPRLRPVRTRGEALRRYRRPLAVACLLLAAAATLNLLSSGQLGRRQVLVAAADLPAGVLLQPTDLSLREIPADRADTQLLTDPQQAAGQRLAVAVPAGTALRDFLLVGPRLLTGAPPGTVAVPLRLSDPATVRLMHPGQLVDIVLTTGDGLEREITSQTIARAVPVLWVPQDSGGTLGMLGAAGSEPEGMIVVAASASLSDDLAGALSRGKVSAVLVG